MSLMEMSVLDLSGDTKVTWDTNNTVEVDHARRTFNELKGRGYTAHYPAGKKGNKPGETMGEFDPNAEGLVMCPQLTAG